MFTLDRLFEWPLWLKILSLSISAAVLQSGLSSLDTQPRFVRELVRWRGPKPTENEAHWHYYWRWSCFSFKAGLAGLVLTFVVSWLAFTPGLPPTAAGICFIPTILTMMAWGAWFGALINAGWLRAIRNRHTYDPIQAKFRYQKFDR